MKKSGFIVGSLGIVFGMAVYRKMRKVSFNKDSLKGKAKEAIGSVTGDQREQTKGVFSQIGGASQEVFQDIKGFVLPRYGSDKKKSGKLKKTVGDLTGNEEQKVKGILEQTNGSVKETVTDIKDSAKSSVARFENQIQSF